jgi:hypothetical protein
MRGFTVRGLSYPSDRKRARRRARQEAIKPALDESLGQTMAEESRSALDAYVREGARQMLQRALECEVEAFLAAHADKTDEKGRKSVVRKGYLPARTIMTGAGPLAFRRLTAIRLPFSEDAIALAAASRQSGDQLRRELHRVEVPPAALFRVIGKAAGLATFQAGNARTNARKVDYDSPLIKPKVNNIDSLGVVEAQQPGTVHPDYVHPGNLRRRRSKNDPPVPRTFPKNQEYHRHHSSWRCRPPAPEAR